MWITSSLQAAKAPTNIALGNFDGVHLGHQQVMAQILCERPAKKGFDQYFFSREAIAALHSGLATTGYSHLSDSHLSDGAITKTDADKATIEPAEPLGQTQAASHTTVVTFSPHPHEYFSGQTRQLLTPVAEKAWQLDQLGVQQLVMLPFDQALANMNPREFVEKILVNGLQAQRISVGSDFHFGKGRSGNAEVLVDIAAEHGIPVIQVPLKHEAGDRISSSRVREALQTGDTDTATRLLGRPYILSGRVVKGQQLGRTLGFPTANLQVPQKKYLPRTGVYQVYVYGVAQSDEPPDEPLKGVMNIGNRPTVSGQSLSIEVHVFDWTGDLYGKPLTVSLAGFLRPEQKFESLDALKAQIQRDGEQARKLFTRS
ncbi:MAG: bifunctional riboflavin kinase/FAD synthetase [Cyanobacteria bacterium J06634_6]